MDKPDSNTIELVLTEEGDTWIAVLVRPEDDAGFAELCEQLEVGRLARTDWQ